MELQKDTQPGQPTTLRLSFQAREAIDLFGGASTELDGHGIPAPSAVSARPDALSIVESAVTRLRTAGSVLEHGQPLTPGTDVIRVTGELETLGIAGYIVDQALRTAEDSERHNERHPYREPDLSHVEYTLAANLITNNALAIPRPDEIRVNIV